jgi:hypothetical protein
MCNQVTKGGCWNAPTAKLSEKLTDADAYFCKTDIASGTTVEDVVCTPGTGTLCCVIVENSQCNKIASCNNPLSSTSPVTCDTTSINTDYACIVIKATGEGKCLGGSAASTTTYSSISSSLDDYLILGTTNAFIPCWNPVSNQFATCTGTSRSCQTDLASGVGSCNNNAAATPTTSFYYCSPMTGETGGCNNYGPSSIQLSSTVTSPSGSARKCYDPNTASSVDCASTDWWCETTFESVGKCSGTAVTPTYSLRCYASSGNLDNCNQVTGRGCWSAASAAVSSLVSGAIFCQTDLTTGVGIEAVTCTPSATVLCCGIITTTGASNPIKQCNKVKSCILSGSSSPCSYSANNKDFTCALNLATISGSDDKCVGGSSSSVTYSSISDKTAFVFIGGQDAVITCWNPKLSQKITCATTDRSCKTDLSDGTGTCATVAGSTPGTAAFGYCNPSTASTGGCNHFGPSEITMTSVNADFSLVDDQVSGAGWVCYNPKTGLDVVCDKTHYLCETTIDGVGKCSTTFATSSGICASKSQCNLVTKAGCWNAVTAKLADYVSGAFFCVVGLSFFH